MFEKIFGESKEKPKETEQDAIDRLFGEGFDVTQSFSREHVQSGEVSTYLANLQAKGKKPQRDYKLFIKESGENLVFEK